MKKDYFLVLDAGTGAARCNIFDRQGKIIAADYAEWHYKTPYYEYEVVNCGARPDQPVDYPQIAVAVAKAILGGECEKGILICGTGIGIGIAANKIPGIIAAHCTDTYSARMAAEHNNANIITLGERITGLEVAKEIVETWLKSRFLGGPHQACLEQIRALEKSSW